MVSQNFRHLRSKIFLNILVTTLWLKYVAADSAWFQVCDVKQKYALSSADCELGLWLNKPMKADCVCVNGVWIVNEDLCDKHAMIIVGSGDCFTITKPIRSVKLLGRPDDPFAPASYVTDENFDTFVEIPDNDYNPRLDAPSSFVISISPQGALRRSDHEICLENKRSRSPVHIWKNHRRVSTRFKFIESSKCETTVPYDFHVRFGEIYHDSEVLYGDSVKQQCTNRCLASPLAMSQQHKPARGLGRAASRGRSLKGPTKATNAKLPAPNIRWENLYNLNKKLDFENGAGLNQAQREYKMNLYNFRWNMTLPALSHSREVREQSVRMIQAQTNFLLLNQSPPKVNTPEYDYFQKLRQVFVGVVPDDVINHDIVNGLMRMFRVVLWESHDKFQYQENPNPEQHLRIMRALNECVWNVTAYPFVFTGDVSDDKAVNPKANSTHSCLEQTKEVYWNQSQVPAAPGADVLFIHSDKDLWNDSIPDTQVNWDQRFNVTKFDFAIELAWKMYLFGFYRCYDYFEKTATDAHEMAFRVESLFNHRVVKRWYQPEDFNKVLPLIFPRLNQRQFAWAVDKMVIASREYGSWINSQLRRPIPMTQKDIVHDDKLSDLAKGRRKRSGRRQQRRQEVFWSNRAHCMNSFSDPIKQFKYAGKQGCYISQPS